MRIFCLFCSLIASLLLADGPVMDYFAPDYRDQRPRALLATVDYLESLFWTQYAPIKWKQHYLKWNPTAEAQIAKSSLSKSSGQSFDYIKMAFNCFLASCQDAHVKALYTDQRMAYIPIYVEWIDNQATVVESTYDNLSPGDRIISINGLATLDYFSLSLYGVPSKNAPLNRLSRNITRLFLRLGTHDSLPDPTLPLTITAINSKGQTKKSVKVYWLTLNTADLTSLASLNTPINTNKDLLNVLNQCLYIDTFEQDYRQAIKQILSSCTCTSSDKKILAARPFIRDSGNSKIKPIKSKRIGYLRIADFVNEDLIPLAQRTLKPMQNSTDALILDLRDNLGGYQLTCWALLSMLTNKPLTNLLESQLLDEQEVWSYSRLASGIEGLLNSTRTDAQLHKLIGNDNEMGFYLTRQYYQDQLIFLKSAIEDWNNGYTCTRFLPMNGQRFIMPHPDVQYTKPLFILINENTSSCADLFPAILKDNNRAVLIGRTTTGAGGSVRHYQVPNFTGIYQFSLTKSLILRNNSLVIEDLGITPDYEYPKTLEDSIDPDQELERIFEFVEQYL